jgi:photosystem II stability/assembly factor-like uncharacterized protein
MRSTAVLLRCLGIGAALMGVLAAAPASAQWTPVEAIPATELFSAFSNGDTVVAGADTAVYVSTNGGSTWQRSSKPAAGVGAITALWVRNGRIYAGTFGQGVFVSDNLGTSWQSFNQGLVGGFLDSQLDVVDFQVRGDQMFAATAGAGVYARTLSGGNWAPFGAVFEPNQDPNVNSLALGGNRLLAMAGGNGDVFFRDPGDPEWTISRLDNIGIHAGLQATTAVFTGAGWVVGSNNGVFSSAAGDKPWTRNDPGLGPLRWVTFASQAGHLFAAFDLALTPAAVVQESDDLGATWQNSEFFPDVFILNLVISGNTLFATRGDGLWRRSLGTTSVPVVTPIRALSFAVSGPQPFREQTRVRFDLPESGTASIELFDVTGRAAGERIEGTWSAGPHEVSVDASRLSPGVYTARLTAGSERAAVRLVHVR